MSYGEWGNSPQPQRSGLGIGRLLLFALLAFIALRMMGAAQRAQEPPAAPAEFPPIEAPRNAPEPNSDWEMSAEPARPSAAPAVKPAPPKPSGSEGDWEMENVPSAKKPAIQKPAVKTEEGDWKIEEVK